MYFSNSNCSFHTSFLILKGPDNIDVATIKNIIIKVYFYQVAQNCTIRIKIHTLSYNWNSKIYENVISKGAFFIYDYEWG